MKMKRKKFIRAKKITAIKKIEEKKDAEEPLTKKLPNHIEEYFTEREASKEIQASKELFRADKENVDVKTDLGFTEVIIFSRLTFNDVILKEKKLIPVFSKFVYPYMRLKISLDRKSRAEFVGINQMMDKTDDILNRMSNISNITGAKK